VRYFFTSWRVSDCEELVGVTHGRWWGWIFSDWMGLLC